MIQLLFIVTFAEMVPIMTQKFAGTVFMVFMSSGYSMMKIWNRVSLEKVQCQLASKFFTILFGKRILLLQISVRVQLDEWLQLTLDSGGLFCFVPIQSPLEIYL